jgi:adenylosuccinate synthase
MSIKFVDVIVDLQFGDTGKGKIAHHLAASGNYNVVMRYNGGPNAGHTVYHNDQKLVTHQVPIGVLYGIPCIIGAGCVVSIPALIEELEMLETAGISTKDLIYIDKRAHIITPEHLAEDQRDTAIGTTRTGIGPAYRSKYGRTGMRMVDLLDQPNHQVFNYVSVIDFYQYSRDNNLRILAEGAQGFHLDIDWGNYPYVTSSHCTVGSVCLNGIPPQKIRNVYGIMKAYETYVGNNNKYTDETNPIFQEIQRVGNEFGATTGRSRKVNWLNMERVIQAININGVTDVIINKADVLEEVGLFGVMDMNGELNTYTDLGEFKSFVNNIIYDNVYDVPEITWSFSPSAL